jgi:tRNA pseudouridine55 synthase
MLNETACVPVFSAHRLEFIVAVFAIMHGVLNVLKPPGPTSHDVVSFVRRALQTKRVGHTGTLDPAASGVLPLCVGQATRLVEYLQAGTKEYIAEATFGYETDSGDAVGNVIAQSDATRISIENLRASLDDFRGEITQTPPIFSAIKQDGRKLYELAREGANENKIEIPTRQVVVSQLQLAQFFDEHNNAPRAMLHIECSGGTYIRSLVRDIGRALGTHATMTFLVRTRSGAFAIEGARTLEEISTLKENALVPMAGVLPLCAAQTIISGEAALAFSQGKAAPLECNAERVAVWNEVQTIAALATRASDKFYKPEKVFLLGNR